MSLSFDNFIVSLNMMPMMEPMLDAVVRIVVDSNLHMPSMFEMHLADDPVAGVFKYIDLTLLAIGTPVKIMAKSMGLADIPERPPDVPSVLFNGEITSLEPHFNDDGTAVMVVRGYDKTHRLHHGRKTKTYQMMTDSAIVSMVAMSAGLLATVTPTTTPHEYVLQNNMTDMEFIRGIAEKVGYDLTVTDLGTFTFKKAGIPSAPGPILIWNESLKSFHPRVTAANQVATAEVLAWDPKLKQPIVGVFPLLPITAQGGPALLAELGLARSRFGASNKMTITDQPLALVPEATVIAETVADRLGADFIQAEGQCMGDPRVKAGRMIEVAGVGLKFSGPYLVTGATHVYDDAGYVVNFRADGREPKTLTTLLSGDGQKPGRIYGVVNGVVTNNMDPLAQGRVKVKFPFLGGLQSVESNWCRVATPMAGGQRGFYCIPEVDDEVLVAFEQGDVNFPYVVGSLWNTMDRQPKPSAAVVMGGKVNQRMWVSRSGHQIVFDDTPGKETIQIIDKTLLNTIKIDSTQNAMTVEMQGPVTFKSVSQDISFECTNFSVKAKANCNLEANANVSVKANANIELKATSQASLEGTAGATVKAAAASVALSGPSVNINNGALEVT